MNAALPDKELERHRIDLNQIVFEGRVNQEFEKLSTDELRRLAHDLGVRSRRANAILQKRDDLQHQKN